MRVSENQAEIRERLLTVLQRLQELGTTQAEVARCVGIASQYLSDVKAGRKPVTKLFALRLGACYEFDHHWLLDGGDPAPQFFGLESPPVSIWELKLFDAPICGDPESHPDWGGKIVALAGLALEHALRASKPYVLRVARSDGEGSVRANDLILISQKVRRKANIHLIQRQQDVFLARKTDRGTWQRVDGRPLGRKVKVVGNCVGVVWRQL